VWTTQVTKPCDEGDIVVTVRAPVGYVGVASAHSCLGRGVCSVKFADIEQQYLFHALVNAEPEWKTLEQGSTFTSANSDQISKFKVMRPKSSEEQTAIAAVLSDMDAEVAALEGRREKTRRIKQGMMQELLTGRTRLV
ncbi:MAG: restriction endonuclease subunit S, partial [Rubrobacteraceae bacterium]